MILFFKKILPLHGGDPFHVPIAMTFFLLLNSWSSLCSFTFVHGDLLCVFLFIFLFMFNVHVCDHLLNLFTCCLIVWMVFNFIKILLLTYKCKWTLFMFFFVFLFMFLTTNKLLPFKPISFLNWFCCKCSEAIISMVGNGGAPPLRFILFVFLFMMILFIFLVMTFLCRFPCFCVDFPMCALPRFASSCSFDTLVIYSFNHKKDYIACILVLGLCMDCFLTLALIYRLTPLHSSGWACKLA